MLRRALFAAMLALPALPAPAQPGDPSFRVVNNTDKVINEVYASPSNDRNWGHDRLGSEVVPPGGRQVIRLPTDGACSYDVRIVYQGGNAEERRNLNTCGMADLVVGGGSAAPRNAPQGNPSFNLVNQSGRVIEEFYASPASQQAWGPDRLGADTLVQPGQSAPVRLPQGECSYDLRVVWQGGQAQERRNVNTCTLTNYIVR
jgi:hypothetical protein